MTDNTVPSTSGDEEVSGFLGTVLISVITSVAISVAALVIYNHWFKSKVNFGFVDVALVNDLGQLVFTDKLSAPGVTDKDRADLYDYVQNYGSTLNTSLERIQKTCECVLMTKAAMIVGGPELIDYTPSVLKDLKLDGIDQQALKRRLVDNVANAKPDPKAEMPAAGEVDLSAFASRIKQR